MLLCDADLTSGSGVSADSAALCFSAGKRHDSSQVDVGDVTDPGGATNVCKRTGKFGFQVQSNLHVTGLCVRFFMLNHQKMVH